MKILAIDYITLLGHRNFNNIHLESLLRQGHTVTYIGRKEALSVEEQPGRINHIYLPDWVYLKKNLSHLYLRRNLIEIEILFWIKKNINFEEYDRIIFLAYNVRSILFFRTKVDVYLINHSNVSKLDNKIDFLLTKLISKRYVHVALNENIVKRMKELLPKRKIVYVPHGLITVPQEEKRPVFINEGEEYIFCPVNSNYDKELLKKVFNSKLFIEFIKQSGIQLYVKDKSLFFENGGVNVLRQRPSIEEYNYMLNHARAIILPYGKDFRYRCSGIFFECIAFDTPVITTSIQDMLIFMNITNTFCCDDIKDFINSIKKIKNKELVRVDKTIFCPDKYWFRILS